MRARPYQARAFLRGVDTFRTHRSGIIVSPTGTGKTVTMGLFAQAASKRILVCAHRGELVQQTAKTLRAMTGKRVEVEQSSQRVNESMFGGPDIVVGTMQTLAASNCRRLNRLALEEFGLLVIDECHRAVCSSYLKIVSAMRKRNPECKVLGFTATPDRGDKTGLGEVFEQVIFEYWTHQAIADGWLVPARCLPVDVLRVDFSKVKRSGGDFSAADLDYLTSEEESLHGFARGLLGAYERKRTIGFCAGVATAERLAEIINRYEPGTAHAVHGKTPADRRRAIFSAHRRGEFPVLLNVGICVEGYDDPGIEVFADFAPTQVRAKYAQKFGRVLRPLPGVVDGPETPEARKAAIAASAKPNAIVLDFVEASSQHSLVGAVDILAGNAPKEVVEMVKDRIKEGASGSVQEIIDEEVQIHEERERSARQRNLRKGIVAEVKVRYREVDPFAEIGLKRPTKNTYQWGPALTDAQLSTIERATKTNPRDMTYAEQKAMLKEVYRRRSKNLWTMPQQRMLAKLGVVPLREPSFQEAGELIDRAKKERGR